MKHLLKLLCALVLVPAFASAKPITIKFSHVVANNTPKGQMALKFEELIEQRLPGKVEVEVFPSSQLFGDNKVLEAMILGDVQMAAPSLSKFQKYTKKLQIFDLPFLFNDLAAAERFQQSADGQALLSSLKKKGLVGLGYLHNGMKQMSSNSPIALPKDVAGKKFRIQTSDVLQAQFEAVDAIPLKSPFSEVFTLLQTKAIDGQATTWSNIYSKKFFEVQEHITETNHGLLDYLVVTSAEFWLGLDKDVREVVKQSLDEAIAYGNNLAHDYAIRDKQAIIDSGLTEVRELTATERHEWINAMKPVWKEFSKEIGQDLINAATANNQP